MKAQILKTHIFIVALFLFTFAAFGRALAQQFPIGTYWVRAGNQERFDEYDQVADCGIDIVVGGALGASTLPDILNAAENEQVTLIVDRIYTDASDSLQWYSGAASYRIEYESTGYSSFPQIQSVEAGIIYDFDHDVGNQITEQPGETEDGLAWQAVPTGGAGLMLYDYTGNPWQHPNTFYRATFRMKVDDNSGHVLVATVRIVQGTTGLVEQQIFSDDFSANLTYQEFEYDFTTGGPVGSESLTLDEIRTMIPEGRPASTNQVDLDYEVEYHGDRTLWVDHVVIENRYGDRLFDGGKDTDLSNDTQWAFNQDAGNETIRGFYVDEPIITEIAPLRYVNNLLGPIAPDRFPNRETMKSTLSTEQVFHQYLNAGLSANQDFKFLIDRYPLDYGSPEPGDAGYNNYIQGQWENQLIPYLEDATVVASFNNRPFWFAVQAHSWDFPGQRWSRNPHPNEIRCMISLALAYGAKGIFYFLYASIPSITGYDGAIGLVDNNFQHNTEPYLSKWNEAQQINQNIQLMAPDLLSLDWQSAYTSGDNPGSSIVQNITNGDDIEISDFTHQSTGESYFVLVNRRCEDTDVQTITVTLTTSGSRRLIEDVLASRVPWDGDDNRVAYRTLESSETDFVVTLNPGEARLFRVADGLAGTISEARYWSGEPFVENDITVSSGVTLTVHACAAVACAAGNGTRITINGSLQAVGTAGDPITFTSTASSPSAGDWDGVFIEEDEGSTLDHCVIEYATFGVFADLPSPLTLENSTLRNNVYGAYLRATVAGVVNVVGNIITQNDFYGIFLYNGADPRIGFNTITSNTLDGIRCITNSDPTIRSIFSDDDHGHNTIHSNGGDGVYAGGTSYPSLGIDYQTTGKDFYGYNEIRSNTGAEVNNSNTSGTIVAERNYWSEDHTDQSATPDSINGDVDYTPILYDEPPNITGGLSPAILAKQTISFDKAFELEIQERFEEAAALYLELLQQQPEADNVGYGVSGLIRCYPDFAPNWPNPLLARL